MKDILDLMTKSKLLDSDERGQESLFFRLKNYYEENGRHKYSEVSRYIFNLGDSDIDVLAVNLNLIAKFAEKKNEDNIKHNINKLIDHTDLAHIQRKYIENEVKKNERLLRGIHQSTMNVRSESQKLTQELVKTKESLNENYNKISSDIDKHKSSIYTQFVTILGIFTAITFGVFGGMEILGNVMSNIVEVRVPKLLMFSSLVIGSILTILYMLLTAISNIVQLPIRNCGCKRDDPCNHTPFQKHPIYFTGMMTTLYLFLIGVISHGYETENLRGIPLLDRIMLNGSGIYILSFLLFIVIMIIFLLINNHIKSSK